MNINIGEGVGPVQFGITKNEAIEILGEPDKIFKTDGNCERLQFNDKLIELSFEPDNDGLLGWIEVHHPDAELFGMKLLGKKKSEVLELLNEYFKYSPETEDFGAMVSLSYDDHWLEFQFEFDRLNCINFGVLYDESEFPIWPAPHKENQ